MAQVTEFLEYCSNYIGAGFHHDTPFADYVDRRTGETLFSDSEAIKFDAAMQQCFDVCSDNQIDIYDIPEL